MVLIRFDAYFNSRVLFYDFTILPIFQSFPDCFDSTMLLFSYIRRGYHHIQFLINSELQMPLSFLFFKP